MHKRHSVVLAGLLAVGTLMQVGTAAAELKIAVIRTDKILREAPQAQVIRAKLQADFERRANELKADAKKFEERAAKFAREKDIMSPADRAKAEKGLYEDRVDLGLRQETLQKDAADRERELTLAGMREINTTIENIAKANGVDVVLRDPIYVKDGTNIDLTDEVLKKLGGK